MALIIGRLGVDVATNDPTSWDVSGNTVKVSGWLNNTTQADALVLGQQAVGFVDSPDEPVVPVRWALDAGRNGFYRVLDASVTSTPASYANNYWAFQVTMQQVPGRAQPLLENIYSGTTRGNATDLANGLTTVDATAPWAAIPAAAYYAEIDDQASPNHLITFATNGGNYKRNGQGTTTQGSTKTGLLSSDGLILYAYLYNAAAVFAPSCSAVARYFLQPSDYYIGAARVEYGASLRTLIGRQIPSGNENAWRISNGLIRVTPSATAGRLDLSWYSGAAWSTVKTFKLGYGTTSTFAGPLTSWKSVTVLLNTPTVCIIRLTGHASLDSAGTNSDPTEAMVVDLQLRRGSRFIVGNLSSSSTGNSNFFVARNANEAMSTTDYVWSNAIDVSHHKFVGRRANVNDGDSLKYVLMAANPTTSIGVAEDTTVGAVYVADTGLSFGIGADITQTGTNNTAQTLVDFCGMYGSAQSVRGIVSTR